MKNFHPLEVVCCQLKVGENLMVKGENRIYIDIPGTTKVTRLLNREFQHIFTHCELRILNAFLISVN